MSPARTFIIGWAMVAAASIWAGEPEGRFRPQRLPRALLAAGIAVMSLGMFQAASQKKEERDARRSSS